MSQTPATTAPVNMANLRGGIEYASQWTLMWHRFRKHKLAVAGMVVVALFYLIALFAEFFAPFDPEEANSRLTYHPPQSIHLFDKDGFRFHVTGYRLERDPNTLKPVFVEDDGRKTDLTLFARGHKYKLLGLIETDVHLIGPKDPNERFFIFGADRMGRDVLSRTIYGGRFTMSLGLVGVCISVLLGISLGGMSGYYGGKIDWVVMRVVEYIISLPTIPIWLALAAALPKNWPPHLQYLGITVVISLIGWTELARVVRGRFLAMRGEVFVIAAKLDGCSESRVIFRHMLPSLASHIIAAVTLAVPFMILSETSLSFLGLGLQPPSISWGVLLKEAQNIRSIASAPWLFIPGACVVLAVLSLNFMGDGLRDAADPYSH
ncbi:MAG: ABC transporter permease [Moraxellaceae bacterium]|nr:ABC transporter permease [Moraxellaceae bacterium]